MSVRAYKLIKVDYVKDATFNVWHNAWLVNLAESDHLDEGGGFISFYKDDIIEELDRLKNMRERGVDYIDPDNGQASTDKDDIDNLDINEAIAIVEQMNKDCGDDEDISYYCF